MLKDFNNYNSLIQIIIATIISIPIIFISVILIVSIFSLSLSSYISTTFLWTGVVAAWLAARNNGGVKKIWSMILSLFSIAFISTTGSLRHLGVIAVSPLLLTRAFSATMIFIGITTTIVFVRKYILYKKIKKQGYKVVDATIALPIVKK